MKAFLGLLSPPGQFWHTIHSNTYTAQMKENKLRLTVAVFVVYIALAAVYIPIYLLVEGNNRYSI